METTLNFSSAHEKAVKNTNLEFSEMVIFKETSVSKLHINIHYPSSGTRELKPLKTGLKTSKPEVQARHMWEDLFH